MPHSLGIMVDHGVLDALADDLGAAVKAIDARLDEMEHAILTEAGPHWSGSARNAFDVSRQKWNNALGEMAALLHQTGAQVSISNGEYHQADKRGADALTM